MFLSFSQDLQKQTFASKHERSSLYSRISCGGIGLMTEVENSRSKNKNKKLLRSEVTMKQMTEFLARPPSKVENLNRNLRKSYDKDFFKDPSFNGFRELSKKTQDDQDSLDQENSQNDSQFSIHNDKRTRQRKLKLKMQKKQKNKNQASQTETPQAKPAQSKRRLKKLKVEEKQSSSSSDSSSGSSSQQSQDSDTEEENVSQQSEDKSKQQREANEPNLKGQSKIQDSIEISKDMKDSSGEIEQKNQQEASRSARPIKRLAQNEGVQSQSKLMADEKAQNSHNQNKNSKSNLLQQKATSALAQPTRSLRSSNRRNQAKQNKKTQSKTTTNGNSSSSRLPNQYRLLFTNQQQALKEFDKHHTPSQREQLQANAQEPIKKSDKGKKAKISTKLVKEQEDLSSKQQSNSQSIYMGRQNRRRSNNQRPVKIQVQSSTSKQPQFQPNNPTKKGIKTRLVKIQPTVMQSQQLNIGQPALRGVIYRVEPRRGYHNLELCQKVIVESMFFRSYPNAATMSQIPLAQILPQATGLSDLKASESQDYNQISVVRKKRIISNLQSDEGQSSTPIVQQKLAVQKEESSQVPRISTRSRGKKLNSLSNSKGI